MIKFMTNIIMQVIKTIIFIETCVINNNKHNAKAVVLIVFGFAPHLEIANFVNRLLQVATFIFVFCMCCL